ncbi:hypothetical protein [Haloarcula pellucida]|uniref:Uncharacterized protein n=1 Tax=Haloarcula pellucida TaxID=1427151 RepID=A0A830GIZ5_9EURY|nr:hypothetical protein [Halomicroarcula pellucida]MBX0348692.1 hypothetical protein [Halomicroarcula pellucida]GGN92188.1 hypothetical protein GCM10009030_16170 [Halomicroarcula pellucida]
MSDSFEWSDSRRFLHRVFVEEPVGVVETVGEVPVCPTCLRAFEASKYGPHICEDCWNEHIERKSAGGRRYVTEHGEKKHYSPLCPHVRGSQYRLTSDESCVYGRLGSCGTCGRGRAISDGGREAFECDGCGEATPTAKRWRYLPPGQPDVGDLQYDDLCPQCSTGKESSRLFRAADDLGGEDGA